MALDANDKRRIMEIARGENAKKRAHSEEDGELRLAGSAAAPIPLGMIPRTARGGILGQLSYRARPILMFGLPPLILVCALAAYSARYDLHRMDVGAVFDSSQGASMRTRFMDQVNIQKRKRMLLDEASGHSFANEHLAAVANADQVLSMEPGHAEAQALRTSALSRQLVYAQGPLEGGDVDAAITRVQEILAVDPEHVAAAAFLQECAHELIRRAWAAAEARDYADAGILVHRTEGILPGFAPATRLHKQLVRLHVTRADKFYLDGDYVSALEEVEAVRRLETDNQRVAGLFEKIDEKVGFPEISVNSLLTLGSKSRVMVAIDGNTVQMREGDVHHNVRVLSIDLAGGVVVFEQIYTGEQKRIIRPRGGRGRTFITPSGAR